MLEECVVTLRESIRVEEVVPGKNKCEGGGMVKRCGKEEENKNNRSVKRNINNA